MDNEERVPDGAAAIKSEDTPRPNGIRIKKERGSLPSIPNDSKQVSRASSEGPEDGRNGSSSLSALDNGSAPKLSRKPSQKASSKTGPLLFDHLADMTEESTKTFQVISDCLYGSRHMGSSEHDAWDCECSEEWRE